MWKKASYVVFFMVIYKIAMNHFPKSKPKLVMAYVKACVFIFFSSKETVKYKTPRLM
jgi:hypothetical protein